MINDRIKDKILAALHTRYDAWSGFQDQNFVADETGYKRLIATEAQQLLAKSQLEKHLEHEQWDRFVEQFELAGQKSVNLLYRSTPKTGDLRLLYDARFEGQHRADLCKALFDLVHGNGSSVDRLGGFVAYLNQKQFKPYWTFPTYYLFVTDTSRNIFVKPRTLHRFFQYVEAENRWSGDTTAVGYQAILDTAEDLWRAFESFGPIDMVDIQSIIYICAEAQQYRSGHPKVRRQSAESPDDRGVPVDAARQTYERGSFSPETFALLDQLDQEPTFAFYQSRQAELQERVVDPFQRVLRQVGERLPGSIRAVMETEKRIFSIFPKNDFGRGGVWSHYWGAFYPKGSRRSQDAQLSMWINCALFEHGFYIGDYGSTQRQRFIRNCTVYRHVLEPLLANLVGDAVRFGDRRDHALQTDGTFAYTGGASPGWGEFLQDPTHFGCDVSYFVAPDALVEMSEGELIEKVLDGCRRLFPLVLLAIRDDPMPAIEEYVAQEFGEESDDPDNEGESPLQPELPLSTIAQESGFAQTELVRWVNAIQRKKQAIFYGPPGTGKTFIARMLAQHLIGGGDGFWELVQFHPAYAYEDFIQGIRPRPLAGGGLDYPRVDGRFLEFCRRAARCNGRCVLIIDEINRANLARVFGELMYLLEYRDHDIALAAGEQRFRIPENVLLLGTMNTADRSIALVDHALRRRFAFIQLEPNYAALNAYHQTMGSGFDVAALIDLLKEINQRIGDPHYHLGISFFTRAALKEEIEDVWRMEIEPYLEEYFFDNREQVGKYRWNVVRQRLSDTADTEA